MSDTVGTDPNSYILPYNNGDGTSNTTSTGVVLGDGDTFDVSSGGTAFATVVGDGAELDVTGTGAMASGSIIQDGGTEDVDNGGIETGSLVSSGGMLTADGGNSLADGPDLGGTVSGATVYDGGQVEVLASGNAINISSGGVVEVFDGGVTSGTQVLNGGTELIAETGSAQGATVSAGGVQVVVAFTPGSDEVFMGPGVDDSYVGSPDELTLTSEGPNGTIVDTFTEVPGGGLSVTADNLTTGQYESGTITSGPIYSSFIDVLGGATAAGTTVMAGGTVILDGGTETALNALPGAEIIVGGQYGIDQIDNANDAGTATVTGVTASGIIVTEGVNLTVSSGNTAVDTVLDPGGEETIKSGATEMLDADNYDTFQAAQIGRVNDSGTFDVLAGGKAVGITVYSGGVLTVSSGGVDQGAILRAGALETVLKGGQEQVKKGNGGDTSPGVVDVAGTIYVLAAASAQGLVIQSGGLDAVLSGGTGFDTMVEAGGVEVISSGGTEYVSASNQLGASAGTVFVDGLYQVEFGGDAFGLIVDRGGLVQVFSGGSATNTVVSAGGFETVEAGGTETLDGENYAPDTAHPGYITVSGTFNVELGATAAGIEIASGGELNVSGGTAYNTLVLAGGVEAILAGGTEVVTSANYATSLQSAGTVDDGGNVDVLSGAQAAGLLVLTGGTAQVESSATAFNTIVQQDGQEIVSAGGTEDLSAANFQGGGTTGGTIYDYGEVNVSAGGIARGVALESGGLETVLAGGSSIDTSYSQGSTEVVSSGGQATLQYSEGLSGDDTGYATIIVGSGGTFLVTGAGADAVGIDVHGDGTLFLASGGQVQSAQVETGGDIYISNGSVATATSDVAGVVFLHPGAEADTTTVGANAQQIVYGTASGSLVSGTEDISAGGITQSTTVLAGGNQQVGPDGTAIGTTVGDGGTEFVSSGGTAEALLVKAGGTATISPNGTLQGVTVAAGGTLSASGQLLGPIEDDGTVYAIGNVNLQGALAGTGTLVITAGATVQGLANGAIANLNLQSGATFTLHGVTVMTDPVDVQSGATLDGTGTLGGAITDDGNIVASSGGLTLTGPVTGSGVITVAPGATVTLDGPVAAGTTVDFAGATGTIDEADPAEFMATIVGTAPGDVVAIVACYVAGTRIATPAGEVSVEDLTLEDSVVTASGKRRPIKWIGRRSYAGRFLEANSGIWPVRFNAGSLGKGVPHRDLLVSPEHAMFLDGLLIPAHCLVNGSTIVQERGLERVDYYHVELDSHDILLAEGAAAESFVDDQSRGMFHNASEYPVLYPDEPRLPARYCAPRVEADEALAAVQRRLAALARPAAAQGPLRGYLDTADGDRVAGWARNPDAPGERVVMRVVVDGAVLGEVVADDLRPDLQAAGEGDGRHGFSFVIPGGVSLQTRHIVEVRRASDSQMLCNSPIVLEPAPFARSTAPAPALPFAGVLDHFDRGRIVGWAWQPGTDAPVALQVLDNGVPLVRTLANLRRPDLRPAGIGDGRHGFDITVPGGLSPLARHVLEVRREADGAALPGTPVVIEPALSFDPALEAAVARAVAALSADEEQDRALSFLLAQTERLLQRRAEAEGGAGQRQALVQFRRRWGPNADAMVEAPQDRGRRALVIDSRLPQAGRDAGSEAMLSHMRSLQTLGYGVSMVAADDLEGDGAALTGTGITCLGLPAYASVEDVLRRQAGCFDVVYLHRAPVASRYLQLVRRYMPRARIVYSVADLHHVRMARQAVIEDRPDLLAASRGMRLAECNAAWSADTVITHSAEEAAELRRAVPAASVHVVPWAMPVAAPRKLRRPTFADRGGVAFIGHGAHAPNADAARWLVEGIMPLVWRADPSIECFLVGSALPEGVRSLAGPRVTVLGHVPDLEAVFGRVRLTVAPLRYGAGVKGKVLTSFAGRTPCVMTPVAAEGLDLPPQLRGLVAENSAGLASLIVRVHADAALIRAAAKTGADLVRRTCSEVVVTATLERALNGHAGKSEKHICVA